jgi:hypothetical protein
MTFRTSRILCLLTAIVALVSCGRPGPASIREVTLVEVARWGAFDDSVATGGGQVAGFVVMASGEVVVTDRRGHRLLRYDRAGRYLGSIGREGSGPLEFRQPAEIAIVADTLYVRDRGNNRIVVIGPGRDLVRTITLNPPRIPTSFSVGLKGTMLGATNGYPPGGLILVWGPDGNQTSTFGELEHEATMVFDGRLVRDRALAGEVAPFLLNWGTTCTTSDESVVLAFHAQPRAQKYSLTGTLRWDVPLSFPESEAVRERWMAANRTSVRGEVLTFWRDVVSDGAGGCWLLLNDPERLTVYHLARDGRLTERLTGPDTPAHRIFWADGELYTLNLTTERFLRFRPDR